MFTQLSVFNFFSFCLVVAYFLGIASVSKLLEEVDDVNKSLCKQQSCNRNEI